MSSVQIKIRLKPSLNPTEIKVKDNSISLPNPRNNSEFVKYTFDAVFNQNASQQDIWDSNKTVIDQAIAGKNITIFAYGQTSSGKTFTMSALIQRTVRHLLSFKSTITASFIEVYDEFYIRSTTKRFSICLP
jgi:DNA replication protein DnaC